MHGIAKQRLARYQFGAEARLQAQGRKLFGRRAHHRVWNQKAWLQRRPIFVGAVPLLREQGRERQHAPHQSGRSVAHSATCGFNSNGAR